MKVIKTANFKIASVVNQPVYHGTGATFNRFSLKHSTQGIIWFTSDIESIRKGEAGASGQGVILELQVNINKAAGWREYDQLMLAQLKQQGFDGAILPGHNGHFDGFVFSPSQVKIVRRLPLKPEQP